MRIVVFGAAGRTGREVVRQALARGHDVTAFVRRGGDGPVDDVRVVEGDARDAGAVSGAVADADVVASVLALMSAGAEPEHSEATRTVVEAAERTGVRRIVVTANTDVLSDREPSGEFAAMGREHRRNRATLEASGLDWTIGAAPWVTDDPPTGSYEAVLDATAPGNRLGAADLATFVLDAIARDDWIGHILGVSVAPTG